MIGFGVQRPLELDVTNRVGATRRERGDEYTNLRNVDRDRGWTQRSLKVALNIPKLRAGSYYPP